MEREETKRYTDGEEAGPQILVVDDVEMNRVLLCKMLEQHGYICDVACNGQEALEKVSNYPYQLVLMDLQMPVMNGLEATWKIRQHKEFHQPRIVAVTAKNALKDQKTCMRMGMDWFLSKPVDIVTLLRVVELMVLNHTPEGVGLKG